MPVYMHKLDGKRVVWIGDVCNVDQNNINDVQYKKLNFALHLPHVMCEGTHNMW